MADDVYKGLGIKRRKGQEPPADSTPSQGDAAEAPASDIRRGLGIKRRSGATSGRAPAADAPAEATGAPASEAQEAEAGAQPEAASGPNLGNDLTANILRNHFKFRTELMDKLPERLFSLKRTHGRYTGDGREQRKLTVGFKPSLVLYVIPPYGIDAPVKFTTKGFVEPGLHRQPAFEEEGFVVDGAFNQIGDMYMYVAFEDDGQPLETQEQSRKSRRGRSSESGRSSSLGLGIKRRKRPE